MAEVALTNVTKRFSSTLAVEEITMTVPDISDMDQHFERVAW